MRKGTDTQPNIAGGCTLDIIVYKPFKNMNCKVCINYMTDEGN